MKSSFTKIFWGFIFVFLELHIMVIDILPDPLGYYLIYSGITALAKKYFIGKKASTWSIVLIIFSIPSIFISQSSLHMTTQIPSFWSIYYTVLSILKLILIFYVFQLLVAISEQVAKKELYMWTKKFFGIYMTTMIAIYLVESFGMNMVSDIVVVMGIFIILAVLIIEIMFLVLIYKYRGLN
ncbi:hypothetical protein [Ornithinibacillus bavariensis]|uniref:Uncharacterized protein n=1 Tax=Ornithinibacillus bavariensis TaxID=545502 RepID=A0A919X7I0_9BACI|nr:hypothetical protein [Ornithinibacillus bavariensis]GIO25882.1 hypothetical protein J43TS3_04930 [Ornithinibacillus bavariensis]